MTVAQATVLAVVEGLTEFLPVSSTGHLILLSAWLGIAGDPFTKLFEVCIQLGAILSVVVIYRERFLSARPKLFYSRLLVSVLPALLCGFLFAKTIDTLLESPFTVGVALSIGGLALLFVDRIFKGADGTVEGLTLFKAFRIGLWQTLALVPGVSRSASTIVGGLHQGLTRSAAAEFSFFMAVPTMLAATSYKLLKAVAQQSHLLGPENLSMLLIGNVVAFATAYVAIRTFVAYLQSHSLQVFGVYRIVLGLVVILSQT